LDLIWAMSVFASEPGLFPPEHPVGKTGNAIRNMAIIHVVVFVIQ